MARQMDVKALISHIVKGDGKDRCRICMGDTTEGQVYLEDCIETDDNETLTLLELLKKVTNVEMELDEDLPRGICKPCFDATIASNKFINLCHQSSEQWNNFNNMVLHLGEPESDDRVFYIFSGDSNIMIKNTKNTSNSKQASDDLNKIFNVESFTKNNDCDLNEPFNFKEKRICYCPDCGKKFFYVQNLNSHLSKTKNRACDVCSAVIKRESIQEHMLKIHKIKYFSCNTCFKLFQTKNQLNNHVSKNHSVKESNCSICGEGINFGYKSLDLHMSCHSLRTCNKCGKTFDNQPCAKHHKNVCLSFKNNESKLFECHDCGQRYERKVSLRTHIVQKHSNILPFECSVCGKRTSTSSHLAEHEEIHKKERRQYYCHQCLSKFKSKLGLNLHQKLHNGDKKYECQICGEGFISASRRSDHVKRKHTTVEDFAHGCPHCPARFIRPFHLRKHLKQFHVVVEDNMVLDYPEGPIGICVLCLESLLKAHEYIKSVQKSEETWTDVITKLNKIPEKNTEETIRAYINKETLQIKIDYVYDKKDDIKKPRKKYFNGKQIRIKPQKLNKSNGPLSKCPFCEKAFPNPYALSAHLQYSPNKDACQFCGKVFNRGDELQDHLDKKHKTKTFKCNLCKQLFLNATDVKTHLKSMHKPGSLTCGDCGKHFNKTSVFEAHSQMHAVRTCRVCDAQFNNRACYKVHRANCEPKPNLKSIPRYIRSNIRDKAIFTCDYCQKTYHSRPQLKNHIVWKHLDLRPFACKVCSKMFHTQARLTEHAIVHTRERKFECDTCGAKLITKMAMVYHKRRHTGEKPHMCEDCGERFISASRKAEHAKRKHRKGTLFTCDVCQHKFARRMELKKHVERCHPIDSIDTNITKLKDILYAHELKDQPWTSHG